MLLRKNNIQIRYAYFATPTQQFSLLDVLCSLRLIQKLTKEYRIKTSRHNGLSAADQGYHILKTVEDDPLGRWGCRLIKEKLSGKGIHIPRYVPLSNFILHNLKLLSSDHIMTFRRLENPEATAARHPRTRKVHHHGLHSSGPNEEWCIDGHEKILNTMGISVYGINDKFSCMELGLWAVPNARLADVPPALYLRLVLAMRGKPILPA